jgi:aminoglycoside phosphotransferase (APT) family kinase protein
LTADLSRVVQALGEITDVDVRPRPSGSRGGPLRPLLDRLDGWLKDPRWYAEALVDVAVVKRLAAEAYEILDEPVAQGFLHGDLIPGNLLVNNRRLTAVLDWGGAGHGDTAQDLAPAWSVLTAPDREVFRQITGADHAAWIRGRTFELEHAVGGVLYYVPRQHTLGDVMSRTLDRILADA